MYILYKVNAYKKTKSTTSLILFTILMVILSLFSIFKAHAANESMYFVVAGSSQVGNTIDVQVKVDPNGTEINAVQADFTYSTSKLQYISTSSIGSSFEIDAPSTGGNGSVSIARATLTNVTADAVVATVKFKVIGVGTSDLAIQNSSSLMRASDNNDCLSIKQNKTIVTFVNADPLGSLDVARTGQGTVTLGGWGFDRSTTTPASIHTYIDGQWLGAYTANKSRPDVASAFSSLGISANTGFSETVSYTQPGTHQLCAWVVGDNIGSPSYGLGCKTFVVN